MSNDFHQFIPPSADHPRRSATAFPDAALVNHRSRTRSIGLRYRLARLLRAVADAEHRLAARLEPQLQPDPEVPAPCN